MKTDYQALITRLRQHADFHADITQQDDDQREWADDLRKAADFIEAAQSIVTHIESWHDGRVN